MSMKLPRAFIMSIEKNCVVRENEVNLHCVKCGSLVSIDWFEKTLECTGCDEI